MCKRITLQRIKTIHVNFRSNSHRVNYDFGWVSLLLMLIYQIYVKVVKFQSIYLQMSNNLLTLAEFLLL